MLDGGDIGHTFFTVIFKNYLDENYSSSLYRFTTRVNRYYRIIL